MKDLKIFTENIEQTALDQINLLMEQDAFKKAKVRIMPDVHAGAGCVIGFTADLGDKVVPEVVGVDIGCGMSVSELGAVEIDYNRLDEIIRENIPSGRNVHNGRAARFDLTQLRCYRELRDTKRLERSIGTLGGGNHFIEVDADKDGNQYFVIHTGSRNLGKQVCEYYQHLAIQTINGSFDIKKRKEELIAEYKATGRKAEIQDALKEIDRQYKPIERMPKDLCYLEGQYRDDYLHDMKLCQEFAILNRKTIADIVVEKMGWTVMDAFESIHNYIDHENNIVRKGAIAAYKGQRVIIPLNMRDGCIIGIGKGNEDWNCSAPHGAGRVLSRAKAKETISMDDYKQSMDGIFTTSVSEDTLDESPMAYKPSEEIIRLVQDTVDIERIVKPVYNFKAAE